MRHKCRPTQPCYAGWITGAGRICAVVLAALLYPAAAGADDAVGLMTVYEDALEADSQLNAAEHGVEAAREREREAFGAWLPSVSANASIDEVRRDEEEGGIGAGDDPREFSREQYSIQLEQPIFSARSSARLNQSQHRTESTRFDRRAQRQQVIQRATEAYLRVLLAEIQTELAEGEVEALEKEKRRVEGLYERQLVSRADRADIEAALAEARSEVVRNRNNIADAYQGLREITNRRYGELQPLSEDIKIAPPDPGNIDAWLDKTRDNNPRLRAAELSQRASREQVAVERAGHYPSLDLVASHSIFDDVDDDEDTQLGTQGREFDETTIGLQLSIPLYSGGQVSASSRAAQAEAAQLKDEVVGLHRALEREVRSAFRDVERAELTIDALEQSVAAKEALVESVQEELEVGRRSVVDLLDARSERLRARFGLAEAKVNYLNARVRLHAAAGILDRASVAWLDSQLSGS